MSEYGFVASEEAASLVLRRKGPWVLWPLSEASSDVLTATRREIGLRVERVFGSFAYRSAVFGEDLLVVADGGFVGSVEAELRRALPVPDESSDKFLALLHEELRAYADYSPDLAWAGLRALRTAWRFGSPAL